MRTTSTSTPVPLGTETPPTIPSNQDPGQHSGHTGGSIPSNQDPGQHSGHTGGTKHLVFGATDIRYRCLNDVLMPRRQPRGPKPNPQQPEPTCGTIKGVARPKPNLTLQTSEGGPSDATHPETKPNLVQPPAAKGRATNAKMEKAGPSGGGSPNLCTGLLETRDLWAECLERETSSKLRS